jgi:hypothetical protein
MEQSQIILKQNSSTLFLGCLPLLRPVISKSITSTTNNQHFQLLRLDRTQVKKENLCHCLLAELMHCLIIHDHTCPSSRKLLIQVSESKGCSIYMAQLCEGKTSPISTEPRIKLHMNHWD